VRENNHIAQRQQRQGDGFSGEDGMSRHEETSLSQTYVGPEYSIASDHRVSTDPGQLKLKRWL
jgi:hypothetical protein